MLARTWCRCMGRLGCGGCGHRTSREREDEESEQDRGDGGRDTPTGYAAYVLTYYLILDGLVRPVSHPTIDRVKVRDGASMLLPSTTTTSNKCLSCVYVCRLDRTQVLWR